MNMQKFNLTMNALDEDLLLEAKKPFHPKKTHYRWLTVAAACIALLVVLPFFSQRTTLSELKALGYHISLPESADNISYKLIQKTQSEVAKVNFTFEGNNYIYEVVKAAEPMVPAELTDNAGVNTTVLSWNSNGLDLCMIESNSDTILNWYSREEQAQHSLRSSVDSNQLLSTAREVLLLTGLNLANAPEHAEDVQYHVFSYQDLVVAETTFNYNGIPCSYRMAASAELSENIIDISELDADFSSVLPGNVNYCRAKLCFTPNQEGKILWYDFVPGIVYSLSFDTGATEATLLQLANELFEPLQGDSE